MDTLENYRFLAANNHTVEKILYIFSCGLLAVDVIATVLMVIVWLMQDGDFSLRPLLLLYTFCGCLLFWAFTMLALKVTNLLRHIYNRLDDSVLDERKETSEEVLAAEENQ